MTIACSNLAARAKKLLEAVSKLPQRNEEASHMEKGTIYFDVVFMANQEATEVSQPGDGALDFPASSIASQLPTVLQFRFDSLGPVWADQVDPPVFQAYSQGIGVGGFVVNQSRRPAPWTTAARSWHRDGAQRFLDERDFVGSRRVQVDSQRNTLAVCHHHPLRTFSAFGFSDAVAPFFAGANEPSANVSSQESRPAASSSPRKVRQICSQSPASSHWLKRRQQVLGDGKSLGKSCHRAPLRSSQRIPSKQGRGSMGGRPPRLEGLVRGRSGAIFSHCASVTSFLVMATPFASQVNHKLMRRANLAATRF